MTKLQKVERHLAVHGSITGKDAYTSYGYYRLSDGIWKLRNRGYAIETIEETDPKTGDEYARYVLLAVPFLPVRKAAA